MTDIISLSLRTGFVDIGNTKDSAGLPATSAGVAGMFPGAAMSGVACVMVAGTRASIALTGRQRTGSSANVLRVSAGNAIARAIQTMRNCVEAAIAADPSG